MPSDEIAGCVENRLLLVLRHQKIERLAASFAGPAEMAVAQSSMLLAPASSNTVWSDPLVKLGASLTAVTLIDEGLGGRVVSTPPLAVPPLSWICTVTVALPLAFAAGV